MDIRQSAQYARYMHAMGWKVEKIGDSNAFRKSFPLIGSFVKIQRPSNNITIKQLINYQKDHRTFRAIIEPDVDSRFKILDSRFKILKSPYSPSKTICIDLQPAHKTIFNSFNPSTRRAVRKAEKLGLIVEQSINIDMFAQMKTKNMFPVGYFMRKDLVKLYHAFRPKHAIILFAYIPSYQPTTHNPKAGVLILFHGTTAYYWQAFSTPEGNKNRAPSLLVWYALKLSKKRKCTIFDFEGIYDPRFPKAFEKWKGFTRFKKGFGGKEIEYPRPFSLTVPMQDK